jgi:hypothetical protein
LALGVTGVEWKRRHEEGMKEGSGCVSEIEAVLMQSLSFGRWEGVKGGLEV